MCTGVHNQRPICIHAPSPALAPESSRLWPARGYHPADSCPCTLGRLFCKKMTVIVIVCTPVYTCSIVTVSEAQNWNAGDLSVLTCSPIIL